MLIEFRVKNFRSFKDEQVLSMVAGTAAEHQKTHCFPCPALGGGKKRLLKSAVVYGANASGKSNLVKAFDAMHQIVTTSAREKEAGGAIDVAPFLLHSETAKAPTLFEVTFVSDGVRYQYGFSAGQRKIHEEWLVAYPKGRPQSLFERNEDRWTFGPRMLGEKHRLRTMTRHDALYVSVGASFNHPQLALVHRWFTKALWLGYGDAPPDRTASRMVRDPSVHRKVMGWLRDADLGIESVEVRQRRVLEADLPKKMPDDIRRPLLRQLMKGHILEVYSRHRMADTGAPVRFDFNDESDGTRCFFSLAGYCLDVLQNGHVLVVDELDASLHPHMTRKILEIFNSPLTNKRNGQIIFSTHDTTLLDPDLLRRDQVWFTEKDKTGASHLYSLIDYRPRKDEALQKGYLAGRYGAVPVLGGFRF
ncbi:MAG: ATP-binding protein [Planctomycetota bacterium]|nr:ATP-binding protein [Planctomycetota bacterium]